ncbi:LPS assembly lipoprotein LptE [Negadavirga shengliensis]|uniref:LPS assembly lipoprotein LptE n=1 Tax=Negadavirga shengliensis TaxID=1389218 RepID=A0ABV9T375_9BACT
MTSKNKRYQFIPVWLLLPLLFHSCKIEYSFTGTTLDYNVTKTFSVENFYNDSGGGPANMGQLFTENLKDFFQRNTQLELVRNNGDLQFLGAISKYVISPQATVSSQDANQPDRAGQMRVTISVEVEFINLANEEENMKRTFSFFQDYDPRSTSLLQVETGLVEKIFENIIQDIFTSTVANW